MHGGTRRDFLRLSALAAGAGMLEPLWAAMKYDRDGVLDLFRLSAAETDAPEAEIIEVIQVPMLKPNSMGSTAE